MADQRAQRPQVMSLFRTWTGQSQKTQKPQTEAANQNGLTQTPSRRPNPSDLTKTNTNSSNADPYAGHLNHLNEHQATQLAKFKTLLEEKKLYRPATETAKASHDDQTLLRYLRARKFDTQGAFGQFKDTEIWYKENKIDELYENIDVEFFEKARHMYPQWTGHRDRRGIPIYVYVVKHLDSKNMASYTKESNAQKKKMPTHAALPAPAKFLPLFALYESLIRFVLPLCTSLEDRPHPEVPITNSNNIVDIHGVGLKQFWNLKSHMQESSLLATSHYPETLDRIFILGAPSFFPTVWSWIKRWFDPVTVSKIFILADHEITTRLSEFIHPDDFPKRYGGNLDWDDGQPPHLTGSVKEALEHDGRHGWVDGPALWIDGRRVPVGSVGGKSRREPVPVVAVVESAPAHSPAPQAVVPVPVPVAVPAPSTEPTPVPPAMVPLPEPAAEPAAPVPPAMVPLPETSGLAPPVAPLPPTEPPSMTHSGSTSTASTSLPQPVPAVVGVLATKEGAVEPGLLVEEGMQTKA